MIKLNGIEIKPTIFPDKTSQVWKIPDVILKETNFVHVTWEFENEAEFLHLAQLKSLLDRHSIESVLRLPYLPYGRQDKKIDNNSTFALLTFAKLLNSLSFKEVICFDPHSDVADYTISNLRIEWPVKDVHLVHDTVNADLLCYPDSGAVSRYSDKMQLAYIHGSKVRNQATGIIDSYELKGDPKDKVILIVDDICDGGMTFILLAKELLTKGAKEVNLFVSHGIFSRGIKPLQEAGIKRIYTRKGQEL